MWIICLLATAFASTAEQLMFSGDVTAALAAAESAASTAPEDVDAQEEYIDLLLNLYLVDNALEQARKRIEAEPTSPDGHYLYGRAQPDVGQAKASYERALKLDPMHARSHMGLGAIYTALGDHDRAAGAYGRAVQVDPTLNEAWLGLSRAHISRGDFEAALAVCAKAMAALPNDPDAYLTASILDPGQAPTLLALAAKNASFDARVHAALADSLLERGQAKKALQAAEEALKINPGEPTATRVKLFASELESGRLSKEGYATLIAIREANQVGPHDALVAANPKSTAALLARSRAHRGARDDASALKDLQAAKVLSPKEPEVLGQLGLVLLDLQRPADAIAPLAAARAARPWDFSLSKAWAIALSRADQHDAALAAFLDLSRRSPYDSALAIAYADALLRARKPEAAYQTVLAAAERRMDEQLVVALMATAAQAGRFAEAAQIMQSIADRTGDPKAAMLAEKLREKASR